MARIVDAIGRVREKRLSCVEAAELLGISERHFRRLRDAYLEGGAEAIIDKRRGRRASNRVEAAIADWVAEQYRTKYFDFTAKHFYEALKRDGFRYGYTWTKSVLYLRGLLKPAKARGPHRRKRPRSPLPGMLVFQDGSMHDWFSERRPPCDLIVTLDDATGAILSAFFVEEEGTEGRGRMERVFGTLQGRLPQELRLAGIDDIEGANAWLASNFVPEFNKRFAIKPEEEGTAFLAFVGDLENILCVQEERTVSNDNCVRYEGRVLQIPEQAHRRHYVKAQVRVHEYQDGSLAIFHGPRQLVRFPAGAEDAPAHPSSACARSAQGQALRATQARRL
jgi:transposase